ncbi:Tetratricopeptide repeat protein [Candidatus Norongarragalina meridionalis]|nr:Tetratricopeptide repeat protein [Candidatus Norongarragalina meridionalis]
MRRLAPARSEKELLQRRALDILGKHPEAVREYFVGELEPAEKKIVAKAYDDLLERLQWAGLVSEPDVTELQSRKNEILGKTRHFVIQSMRYEKNAIDRYRMLLSVLDKDGGFQGAHMPEANDTKEILLGRNDPELGATAMHEIMHALQHGGYIRIKNNAENQEPIAVLFDNLYLAEKISGGADRRISRNALDEILREYSSTKSFWSAETRPAEIPSEIWNAEKRKASSNNNHAEGGADAIQILGRALASGMPMREVWKQAGAFLGAKYFSETDAHPEDQPYIDAYLAERDKNFAGAAELYQTLLRKAPDWNRERLRLRIAENYLRARRYSEAIRWFGKVSEPFDSNLGIARAHYALDDFEKAAAFAEKATKIKPDASAYTILGNAYMNLKQVEKARAAHDRAGKLIAT